MSDDFNKEKLLCDMEERMEKALNTLEKEYEKLRTGRASSSIVEGIKVEYNGAMTPIVHLSTVSVQDSRTITIKPWDKASMIAIEKAIIYAGTGLTPCNVGDKITISIPPLTEERRKELVKVGKKLTEDAKIAIRNIRRDGNDTLKKKEKEKTITEDESKFVHNEIQKLTDSFIEQADVKYTAKEKEIREV
ncbi:MAG: ribosome recycling factor [Desulfovibrionaceae bacterium]